MKINNIILSLLILASVFIVACSNDEITSPIVKGVKFYSVINNEFVEVTNPLKGVTYTIGVESTADMVVVWPGGERVTMQKKGTAIDSTDINGKVVLTKSNYYSDYGLLRAQGLKTSLNAKIGWILSYKYPYAGDFALTVIATNHGYDSDNYNQKVFPFSVKIQ